MAAARFQTRPDGRRFQSASDYTARCLTPNRSSLQLAIDVKVKIQINGRITLDSELALQLNRCRARFERVIRKKEMVSTTKPQVMEASSLTKATIRWPLRGVHSGEGGAEDGHRVQIEGVSAGHAVKKHHAVSRQQGKRRFCHVGLDRGPLLVDASVSSSPIHWSDSTASTKRFTVTSEFTKR